MKKAAARSIKIFILSFRNFILVWIKCKKNKIFPLFSASALKCWRCSSDASNAAFCDDPFDQSIITEQQRRWSFVECSFPPTQINPYNSNGQTRAVCKKVKQLSKFLLCCLFLYDPKFFLCVTYYNDSFVRETLSTMKAAKQNKWNKKDRGWEDELVYISIYFWGFVKSIRNMNNMFVLKRISFLVNTHFPVTEHIITNP